MLCRRLQAHVVRCETDRTEADRGLREGERMNACAVRMIHAIRATDRLRGFDLPHEPKSEHRFAVARVPSNPSHPVNGFVGNYAECKHCNAIYSAHEEQK